MTTLLPPPVPPLMGSLEDFEKARPLMEDLCSQAEAAWGCQAALMFERALRGPLPPGSRFAFKTDYEGGFLAQLMIPRAGGGEADASDISLAVAERARAAAPRSPAAAPAEPLFDLGGLGGEFSAEQAEDFCRADEMAEEALRLLHARAPGLFWNAIRTGRAQASPGTAVHIAKQLGMDLSAAMVEAARLAPHCPKAPSRRPPSL